jgi:hypothetical protein
VFNNAAQVWNHSFYWNCLSPNGGGEPTGALADAINAAFGSFAEFKEQFTARRSTTSAPAGPGWYRSRRLRSHPQHQQRRLPADRGRHPAADRGRLGARLLHRLPQRPTQVPGGVLEPGELGVCRRPTWPDQHPLAPAAAGSPIERWPLQRPERRLFCARTARRPRGVYENTNSRSQKKPGLQSRPGLCSSQGGEAYIMPRRPAEPCA